MIRVFIRSLGLLEDEVVELLGILEQTGSGGDLEVFTVDQVVDQVLPDHPSLHGSAWNFPWDRIRTDADRRAIAHPAPRVICVAKLVYGAAAKAA
ncbi:MAG: hypothetical protein HY567_03410 [Candidatus Kerfeldbacteria bacterium]|nr:hypothetical protein [Candidatus Kerfeldbacteria bacterium]